MTERYLSQLAVITANDQVSAWLFIGVLMCVAALGLSKFIANDYLRHVVVYTVAFISIAAFFILLVTPML